MADTTGAGALSSGLLTDTFVVTRPEPLHVVGSVAVPDAAWNAKKQEVKADREHEAVRRTYDQVKARQEQLD
jgi:hypothetical protein